MCVLYIHTVLHSTVCMYIHTYASWAYPRSISCASGVLAHVRTYVQPTCSHSTKNSPPLLSSTSLHFMRTTEYIHTTRTIGDFTSPLDMTWCFFFFFAQSWFGGCCAVLYCIVYTYVCIHACNLGMYVPCHPCHVYTWTWFRMY